MLIKNLLTKMNTLHGMFFLKNETEDQINNFLNLKKDFQILNLNY